MPAQTPAPVVLSALVAALTADVPLGALLHAPGVYSGRAPRDAQMPYLVIDDLAADKLPTFSGDTGRGTFHLRIWADDVVRVLGIFAALHAATDNRRLVLAGFVQLLAKTALTTTVPDPGDNSGHSGVVTYEWAAQVQA